MKVTLFALIATVLLACAPQNKEPRSPETIVVQAGKFEHISPKEMEAMIEEKPGIILDVRTPQETAQGVIKDAVFLDFNGDNFSDKLTELEKGKPIYVYCASGRRSSITAKMLIKAGYTEVYNLDGGIQGWKASSLPVEKP